MKKGYVIAIRTDLRDEAEMATYTEKVMTTFPASWKPLVAYGRQEVMEGPASDGAVIIEFESFDAAKAWYGSEAYAEAKKHRLAGADYHFIVVEGL
ncbi:MAG: DUF1330 domain-containing protein [Sphingobium sp.]